MSITLQILLLAVGFILIAAVIYTLYSFIIGMGPVSFAKKFWHVTLLPEGILALLFFLLNCADFLCFCFNSSDVFIIYSFCQKRNTVILSKLSSCFLCILSF